MTFNRKRKITVKAWILMRVEVPLYRQNRFIAEIVTFGKHGEVANSKMAKITIKQLITRSDDILKKGKVSIDIR